MKKILQILIIAIFMLFATGAFCADVGLSWDASPGATGYRIYVSVDNGATWPGITDVGNITNCVIPNVPDSGLILFKAGAYNSQGESIRSWSGAWYNGDWKLNSPGGTGIK